MYGCGFNKALTSNRHFTVLIENDSASFSYVLCNQGQLLLLSASLQSRMLHRNPCSTRHSLFDLSQHLPQGR
jgi:hypothetical protein